jgi:hypothetical protein
MPAELVSLPTALGLLAVALLSALYLLYEHILALFAWLAHAGFLAGFALAASALLLEPPYAELGERALVHSGVPARLREADAFAERVQRMPERILERVRHPFSSPAQPPVPLAAIPGPLESAVLPGLRRLLCAALRALALAAGLVLMSLALLARPAVDLVLSDRALRRRVAALEARTPRG